MNQRHTLPQRLQQAQALLAPGVYDAMTALVAQQAGFEALYLSGASIAYTRLGRSDHGKALRYSRDGTGANVLGDPRIALTWLANRLSSLGITLQKGQWVTTGTCMVPLELDSGDRVSVDFGWLGRVNMIFSQR